MRYKPLAPAAVPRGAAEAEAAAVARQREWFGPIDDPDGDCAVAISPRGLSIGLPAAPHQRGRAPAADNAPRTTRAVGGDFDATVTVMVALPPGLPWVGEKGRVGGGLLLTNGWGVSTSVGVYYTVREKQDGKFSLEVESDYCDLDGSAGSQSVVAGVGESAAVRLRLSRRGGWVTACYQNPSDEPWWALAGGAVLPLPDRVTVGVFAINATGRPAAVGFACPAVEAAQAGAK